MAKIWKKLLMAILLIACLFNIVNKIVKKYSLRQEVESSIQYMEQTNMEQTNENSNIEQNK